jgi:hypothetical protein
MVIMCKIALPLWMIANILPQLSAFVASSFPKTGYGWNILWVYNMMNPTMGQVQGFLTRNAGCSWEPGRFAIMLCLAVLINLLYRGVTFYKNRNVLWLIASHLTTFSTTGYVIVAGLYVIFLKKRTGSQYIKLLLVAIAMGVMGSQLNFVGEKLQKKLNLSEQIEQTENNQIWFETQEQMAAIDRIPSLYYEWTNFMHNPWIGYGQDFNESYFAQNFTSYYSLTGGLIKMFSVYGIFLGFLFYLLLYKSSVRIASEFHSDKKWVVFFCFCLSMISYPLSLFSIYTAIWLYNDFIKERR